MGEKYLIWIFLIISFIGLIFLNYHTMTKMDEKISLLENNLTILKNRANNISNETITRLRNDCFVNSRLTSKKYEPRLTGDLHCPDTSKCIATYFSEVPNPENPDFILKNTIQTQCYLIYQGHTESYYIQTVCCN